MCGWVLDHALTSLVPGGRVPPARERAVAGGSENRARAAVLDFGGVTSPEALRMLRCDAAVVPIVLNGKGQLVDVGRATRTIP